MPGLPPAEEALAGVAPVAAADALAVVPESGEALRAGAPVEPCWLDRRRPAPATRRDAPEEPWTTARNLARNAAA